MPASAARRVAAPLSLAGLLVLATLALLGGPLLATGAAQSSRGTVVAPDPCLRSAGTVTCTYAFTGREEQFIVPAGVTSVDVEAIGAPGGWVSLPTSGRGLGGRVTVDGLAVTPGQTLYVAVGGAGGVASCRSGSGTVAGGAGGWNGGGNGGAGIQFNCPTSIPVPDGPGMGGGGASDVRTHSRDDATKPLTGDATSDPRILVAGGGGGNAIYTRGGGNAGVPAGGDGAQGTDVGGTGPLRTGGFGGTATAGGQPGWGNYEFEPFKAYPGSAGAGGRGQQNSGGAWQYGGGGGGGGWFGGGGGASIGTASGGGNAVGGGGGGSSRVPAGGTIEQPSGESARVVFTYPLPPDVTAPTVSIAAPVDGATYEPGESVAADFTCADEAGGSGVATCAGTTADGDEIDLAAAGTKTFTVTATDAAGNASTETVQYEVVEPDGSGPSTGKGTGEGVVAAAGGGSAGAAQSVAGTRPEPAPLRILSARLHADGSVRATVQVPGPGTLIGLATLARTVAKGSAVKPGPGRARYAEMRLQRRAGGVVHLRLKPNAAMRRTVLRRKSGTRVRLTVAFGRPPHDLVRQVRVLRTPKPRR